MPTIEQRMVNAHKFGRAMAQQKDAHIVFEAFYAGYVRERVRMNTNEIFPAPAHAAGLTIEGSKHDTRT